MSWDEMNKSKSDSGRYIKLKDGQTIEGVFMGDPHCFYSIFKDYTEYPDWKEGRSFKFKVNFIMRDEQGQLVARVFQGSSKVRDMLIDVKNEYGLDCVYKIKRTGSSKDDTRYSILFKAKLDPAVLEKMKSIKLHELKRNPASNSDEDSFDTSSFDESVIPENDPFAGL